MILILPLDFNVLVPLSLFIDKLVLDFDVLDVMFWFPRLSWAEFGRALAAVLVCKYLSDQVERWAFAPLKARLKRVLGGAIASRFPRLARRA